MTASPERDARTADPDLPVFDAHVDSLQRALDLDVDLGLPGRGHLDLPRGHAGGLGAVVMAAWVEPIHLDPDGGGGARRTRALIGCLQALAARHPESCALVGNGRELEEARRAGRLALISSIEGGHSIEGSLERLEEFFHAGLRMMTLVWNNHLPWIRSCQAGANGDVPAGLSAFGLEVVARMNELGIVVDLAHAGERSFHDALEASSRPVFASHTACRALHDHPRNLTDEQLRALGESGGVCGLLFYPGFLDPEGKAELGRLYASAEFRDLAAEQPGERELLRAAYVQERFRSTTLERVVDHVAHAAEVCGVEHVGLGSDFDGIECSALGLEDASRYPLLLDALSRRGFSRDEVRAVAGGNMRRVFAEATGVGTLAAEAPTVRLA